MIYGISKQPDIGNYYTCKFKNWEVATTYEKEYDFFFCESVFEKELKRRQEGLKVNDTPQQPTYYKSKFDVVDFMDSLPVRLPWLVGDTIKRIIRFEHKEPKKDLEKIKYNIERLKNSKKAKKKFNFSYKWRKREGLANNKARDLVLKLCDSYDLKTHQRILIFQIFEGKLDNYTDNLLNRLENLIKD